MQLTIQLWQYLLAAMLSWTQLPTHCAENPRQACNDWATLYTEAPQDSEARYTQIAREIAAEAAWRQKQEGNRYTTTMAARYALDLLSIAKFESAGFSILVDNGTCNKRNLDSKTHARVKALGGCDNGYAFTMWQFHPDLITDAARNVKGVDLVADRMQSIHIAWDLRRIRPRAWSTWSHARANSLRWESAHPLKDILLEEPLDEEASNE